VRNILFICNNLWRHNMNMECKLNNWDLCNDGSITSKYIKVGTVIYIHCFITLYNLEHSYIHGFDTLEYFKTWWHYIYFKIKAKPVSQRSNHLLRYKRFHILQCVTSFLFNSQSGPNLRSQPWYDVVNVIV